MSVLCASLVHATPAPVQTESGLVQGFTWSDGLVDVWSGLPYAAPPLGNLRFAKPQPHAPWNGTFEADTKGVECLQGAGEGSEDCLLLNVWSPVSRTAAAPLPVFVCQ